MAIGALDGLLRVFRSTNGGAELLPKCRQRRFAAQF
jgi:hypothetical protein